MIRDVTVVVPLFNEATALRRHLPGWLEWCRKNGWQMVLVDDGSTDATAEALAPYLRRRSLTVLRHRKNRGYGSALKTGILHTQTDLVGTMDGDGQHSIEDLGRLVTQAQETGAEVVIGSRGRRGASGAYREIGKAILRWIARLLFGVRLQDLNSGMKVYRTRLAKDLLRYCPDSMAFSDVLTLTHINLGCLVIEVPIEVAARRSGQSTINTMTAVDTLVEIVNVLMGFRPLKVFVPLAGVFLAAGALWSVPFLVMGRGLSSSSLLMLLTGAIIGMLGLLAEQLAAARRAGMPEVEAEEMSVKRPARRSPRRAER